MRSFLKQTIFCDINIFASICELSSLPRKTLHLTHQNMATGNDDGRSGPKPKLIVFDLDCTMWPFHVDTHVDPPFKFDKNGTIRDAFGYQVTTYPDVPGILDRVKREGIKMAFASRTDCPHTSKALIKILEWEKYAEFREIYPGRKTTHFKRFHENSGIAYNDMIFYDDEYRNIVDVSKLGVTCIYTPDGLSNKEFEKGLKEFAANRRKL